MHELCTQRKIDGTRRDYATATQIGVGVTIVDVGIDADGIGVAEVTSIPMNIGGGSSAFH